jgi:hypothetical protein
MCARVRAHARLSVTEGCSWPAACCSAAARDDEQVCLAGPPLPPPPLHMAMSGDGVLLAGVEGAHARVRCFCVPCITIRTALRFACARIPVPVYVCGVRASLLEYNFQSPRP